MERRILSAILPLYLFFITADCSRALLVAPALPTSASFGWKLVGIAETKPQDAPEVVKAAGFRKSWRAGYQGPGTAYVDLYRTKSQSGGLDMAQRWRPAAQTVTLFNNSYFVVISWSGANRAAATALVGQIERSLPNSD